MARDLSSRRIRNAFTLALFWSVAAVLFLSPSAEARGNVFLRTPCRLFDTRSTPGMPTFTDGTPRIVQISGACGVPSGATAVFGNLTATNANVYQAYVNIYAGDDTTPVASALNYDTGETISNLVAVPLSATGTIAVKVVMFGTAPLSTDVIFDVVGYSGWSETPPESGVVGPLGYQPVRTCRLADTRLEGGRLVAGEDRAFAVQGRCDLPVGIAGAAMNLTAIQGSAGGHLAPHADGTVAGVAPLNFPAGVNLAKGVVSRLGTAVGSDLRLKHVSVSTSGTVDAVLDAHGFFTPGARSHYSPIRPCRLLDTRTTNTPFNKGERRTVDVVNGCSLLNTVYTHRAAFVNVTVVGPTSSGNLVASRTDEPALPVSSVLNFAAGEWAIGNGMIVEVNEGRDFDLTAQLNQVGGTTHVVVDVFGYFMAADSGDPDTPPPVGGSTTGSGTGTGLVLADGLHPATERGLDPTHTYAMGDLDAVNLFNGNLAVNLPIGTSYPTGHGLGYGFNLSYNSKLFDNVLHAVSVGGSTGHWLTYTETVPNRLSNAGVGWVLGLGGRLLSPDDDENNSGGPLIKGRRRDPMPSWVYVAPDGSEHVFYAQLNYYGVPAGDTDAYTRDGSYLRMHVRSDSLRDVAFPDGRTFVFRHVNFPLFDGGNEREWVLVAMLTPYDAVDASGTASGPNYVSVKYDVAVEGGKNYLRWKVNDAHGREQQVLFEKDPYGHARMGRLHVVRLTAAHGATAEWQFQYADEAGVTAQVYRCGDNWPENGSDVINVSRLERVITPVGTAYVLQYNAVDPSANGCNNGGALLRSMALPTAGTQTTSCNNAACGGIEWTYGAYQLPLATCDKRLFSLTPGVLSRTTHAGSGAPGATWNYSPSLNSIGSSRLVECVADDDNFPYESEIHHTYTNTVTDPTGDRTIHHFSVFPRQNYTEDPNRNDPADYWEEYGLPLTRRDSHLAGGRTLFLSTEVQDCNGGSCSTVAKTYVRYERDRSLFGPFAEATDRYDLQQRPSADRTLHTTSNPHYVETVRSLFDGLGHYRVSTSQGGGWEGAGTARTVTQQYNSTNGTYLLDDLNSQPVPPSGPGQPYHDYTPKPAGAKWFLELYDSVATAQGASVEKEQACFNAATGFLERRRLFKNGASAGGADTIVVYLDNGAGNVGRETFYGGDKASLSTADVCGGYSFPASAFALDRTYAGGLPATTTWLDASGNALLRRYDATVDVSGARVVATQEPDGIRTNYAYDLLGRLTSMRPGEGQQGQGLFGAWTLFTYNNAAGSGCTAANPAVTCATVRVDKFPYGALSGATLTRRRLVFDGLGRPIRDGEGLPGTDAATWSEVVTSYDGRGQVLSETPRHTSPGAATTYARDVFGRVTKITPPDAQSHAVDVFYDGVRSETRTAQVARFTSAFPTTPGLDRPNIVESPSQTTSTFDAGGRVIRVLENANGPASEQLKTEYGYDVGDRLTSVVMTEGSTQVQTRSFSYDGIGRLRGENHPELNHLNGLATSCGAGARLYDVVHDEYDALGVSHRRCDDQQDLLFNHDRASRPTEVRHFSAVQGVNGTACEQAPFGVCLRTFAYGWGASAGDRSKGKLVSASSYTYRTDPYAGKNLFAAVQLTYNYGYNGQLAVDGRMSNRMLQLAWTTNPAGPLAASSERLWQSYSYNALGLPSSVSYPDPICSFDCVVAGDVPTSRSLALGYGEGRLTSIATYAPSITYSGNGLVRRVTFWPGSAGGGATAVWQQDPDTSKLPRPKAICSGSPTNPSADCVGGLGPYLYDGAGNVKQVGGEVYVYDAYGRVVYGQMSTGEYQRYVFDGLGNVQSKVNGVATTVNGAVKVTDQSALLTTTTKSTNRLASASYDDRGNMIGWNGNVYGYDEFNNLAIVHTGNEHWWHFYDVDGQRVWSFHHGLYGNPATRLDKWSARGPGGELLRELTPTNDNGLWTWHWSKDYVYRDGVAIAYETPAGRGRYFIDHLATPRQVLAENGTTRAHHYYPFGEEAFFTSGDAERIGFTSHERDLHGLTGQGDDLDYMHARHYNPISARFLSVDPVMGRVADPQSWNRYAYALGNPVTMLDPDGRTVWTFDGLYRSQWLSYADGQIIYHSFSQQGPQAAGLVLYRDPNTNTVEALDSFADQAQVSIHTESDDSIEANPTADPISFMSGAVGSSLAREGTEMAVSATAVRMTTGVRGAAGTELLERTGRGGAQVFIIRGVNASGKTFTRFASKWQVRLFKLVNFFKGGAEHYTIEVAAHTAAHELEHEEKHPE